MWDRTCLYSKGSGRKATIRLALNAIVFLYREAYQKEPGDFSDYMRTKVRTRLPVVLTRDEISILFNQLHGTYRLMGQVAYGAGIRAMELLGHESVETTQIYTHVMAKPGLGVKSPLDF